MVLWGGKHGNSSNFADPLGAVRSEDRSSELKLVYRQILHLFTFLAVQNSSIGDLVPWSVGPAPLTIREFTTLQSDPRDL